MRYTANSVKKALEDSEKNNMLYAEDLDSLRCPAADLIFEDGQRCGGSPKDCRKAQSRTCRRRVKIYRGKAKNLAPFAVLNFYFTISDTDADGFIDAEDSMLRLLIAKEFITEERLKIVAEC